MSRPTRHCPPALFSIPADQLAKAAKPADPKITPFQWIIRRGGSGFYFDADASYVDDGDQMKWMDIAPNVGLAMGNTHNTVFIATNTYLIAIEAPNDDGQAKGAIALAKQHFPGKPIKYLVLTHHHVDHVGGMRTFAAEGATLVFGRGNGSQRPVLPESHRQHPGAELEQAGQCRTTTRRSSRSRTASGP